MNRVLKSLAISLVIIAGLVIFCGLIVSVMYLGQYFFGAEIGKLAGLAILCFMMIFGFVYAMVGNK